MAALSPEATSKGLSIRKAAAEDVPALQSIINASYSKYIERLGKPPAPMTADYHGLLKTRDVFVLESACEDGSARAVGSITLGIEAEQDAVRINSLAVEPAAQGRGYGRALMDFAEDVARVRGIGSMTLFTNVKMHENIGLYLKLGYVETERKSEDGYDRVYFRKQLKATQ
ncbi:acetyltransferase [Trichoderma cornu-damae]|uniref:Acetyltransferase n=1 Tax=Trichoderma cornu-damae TaxID=654480 RepID=A0A9P8TZV9_9HYPO|nr:acetyltransferase [Trichoderma cornu-damae]